MTGIQEILYQTIEGIEEEVMRFDGDQPVFKRDDLEAFYRMFPISIPQAYRSNFDNKKVVLFPDDNANDRDFELFKKALKLEVASKPSYRNYQWVVVTKTQKQKEKSNS